MSKDYVPINRAVFRSKVWRSLSQREQAIYMELVARAKYKREKEPLILPVKGVKKNLGEVTLEPGECLASIKGLRKITRDEYTESEVRWSLDKLKDTAKLITWRTAKGNIRIVTVKHWQKYFTVKGEQQSNIPNNNNKQELKTFTKNKSYRYKNEADTFAESFDPDDVDFD